MRIFATLLLPAVATASVLNFKTTNAGDPAISISRTPGNKLDLACPSGTTDLCAISGMAVDIATLKEKVARLECIQGGLYWDSVASACSTPITTCADLPAGTPSGYFDLSSGRRVCK